MHFHLITDKVLKVMKNIFNWIKSHNKKLSSSFVGTKYYWMRSPSNLLLFKHSKESIKKYAKGKSVLDAGAGRLAYRDLIKTYAKSYTSSDFKRTHPELDVVCDLERLDFRSSSFDIIFCSQVLEHVPHPWIAMSEIYRVLKNYGVGIITVPMLGYIHNAPFDYFRYTEYGLKSLAQDSGFKVLKIMPIGGLFCFVGYVLSTIFMPVFRIPIFGILLLYIIQPLHMILISLDKLIANEKVFPLNYLMIIKKI